MQTNAERFYKRLSSVRALQALVGKPEDAGFDCKEWPARQNDARRIISKAACGFTNATGGVIVIGVKASGAGANSPDVVRSLAPVADRHAVASAALDIILQSVEPVTRLVNKYNIFVLEVLKAWIDPAQKHPKTIHHQGYGRFVVDGEIIKLKSGKP